MGKYHHGTRFACGEVDLSGNGLSNTGQYAPGVSLWGLPTCTSFSTSGNGCFYETVYVPEASASLTGVGSSGGFYGSIMANTITLTGGASVSFDEAIKNLWGTGFVPSSWAEH